MAGVAYGQGTPGQGASGQWRQEELGLSGGFDAEAIDKADRISANAQTEILALQKTGIDALTAKNYALADHAFAELLRRDPKDPDVNFLMGLTQIGLAKLTDAKGFLEIAVAQNPQRPEAHTRLALTYLQLADTDAAQKQRAELVRLDKACSHACKDAIWIADGITELDRAFEARKPKAVVQPVSLSVSATLKASDYGSAQIKSADDVFPLLTAVGRCPPGFKAAREEPCALIAYVPAHDAPGVFKQYYRPIFGVVNRNTIWTIVDSRAVSVSPKTLWSPVEVENTVTKGVKDTYYPLAVMGNQENADKCSQTAPCLPQTELFQHYRDHKALPQKFVDDFWGKRLADPGQKKFTTER